MRKIRHEAGNWGEWGGKGGRGGIVIPVVGLLGRFWGFVFGEGEERGGEGGESFGLDWI